MNLVLLKNISLVGVHWVRRDTLMQSATSADAHLPQGAYTKNEQERIPEVWAALLQLLREGQLRPVIFDKIYE